MLIVGTLPETTGYCIDNAAELSPKSLKRIRKEWNEMASHVIFVLKTLIC
jgi:hypothetical protein